MLVFVLTWAVMSLPSVLLAAKLLLVYLRRHHVQNSA